MPSPKSPQTPIDFVRQAVLVKGGFVSGPEQESGLRWATYFALATQVAFYVIGGILLGIAADRWLGTTPLFMILLVLGGLAAGFYNLIRGLRLNGKRGKSNSSKASAD